MKKSSAIGIGLGVAITVALAAFTVYDTNRTLDAKVEAVERTEISADDYIYLQANMSTSPGLKPHVIEALSDDGKIDRGELASIYEIATRVNLEDRRNELTKEASK